MRPKRQNMQPLWPMVFRIHIIIFSGFRQFFSIMLMDGHTDIQTDVWTDIRTVTPSHRDAWTHLKSTENMKLCHLEGDSDTNMRTDCQNAYDLCSVSLGNVKNDLHHLSPLLRSVTVETGTDKFFVVGRACELSAFSYAPIFMNKTGPSR